MTRCRNARMRIQVLMLMECSACQCNYLICCATAKEMLGGCKRMLKTAVQRESLATSPDSRDKWHRTSLMDLSTGQKAKWPELRRKKAKKTKEAREERGALSCCRDMRDFVFLGQNHTGEVIRYRTYQPEVLSFGSSAESDVLRFIKPRVIVYGPINRE